LESARGVQLIDIIRSDSLKAAVGSLGGYDPARAGEILFQQ
jgi:hypothetical protein